MIDLFIRPTQMTQVATVCWSSITIDTFRFTTAASKPFEQPAKHSVW